MGSPEITSPSNPRIRRLVSLRDRRERDREGVFLVEGGREIGMALAAGITPVEIYWDPGRFADPPADAPITTSVSAEALDRASYRGRSQGTIAVFAQFDVTLSHLLPGPSPLVLVAEAIEKPGNLGALLRTADAVGADALLAADPGTDPFSPNVVRASMGALFTVPLAVSSIDDAFAWLKAREIEVIAADPASGSDLWSADLTGSRALLVGSEHLGLSPEARAGADQTVAIPMRGAADSLNVSVSMAILAYEALRQRWKGSGS